jgi:hypothetical protein
MLRKPLVLAALALALAAPSPALAMHGPREQAPRLPRNMESRRPFAPAPIVIVSAASNPFSWLDAGIGALVSGGCVLALVGGRLVAIQRRLHQLS